MSNKLTFTLLKDLELQTTREQTQEEIKQTKALGHHESSTCELGQIAKKQGPKIHERTWK